MSLPEITAETFEDWGWRAVFPQQNTLKLLFMGGERLERIRLMFDFIYMRSIRLA